MHRFHRVLSTITAAVVVFLSFACGSSSSSSSAYTNKYESSVRSLDEYGNAVQLRHAKAAADRHGRLIMVLRLPEENSSYKECLWVVSAIAKDNAHHRHHHDHERRRRQRQEGGPRNGNEEEDGGGGGGGVVHLLQDPSPASIGGGHNSAKLTCPRNLVAVVCSGLQADAVWLTRRLHTYAMQRWERYGGSCGAPSPAAVSLAASDWKRSFWGYSPSSSSSSTNGARDAWMGPARTSSSLDFDGDDTDDAYSIAPWSRPLGVRTLILSVTDDGTTSLRLVEPSGSVAIDSSRGVSRRRCIVMGRNGDAVQERLEERLREAEAETVFDDDDDEQQKRGKGLRSRQNIEEVLVDCLRSTLGSVAPEELLIEALSSDGIVNRRRISTTNSK